MTALDPAALRRRFPALARTGEDGLPVIYADAPGGSQVPETVIDAIAAIYGAGSATRTARSRRARRPTR